MLELLRILLPTLASLLRSRRNLAIDNLLQRRDRFFWLVVRRFYPSRSSDPPRRRRPADGSNICPNRRLIAIAWPRYSPRVTRLRASACSEIRNVVWRRLVGGYALRLAVKFRNVVWKACRRRSASRGAFGRTLRSQCLARTDRYRSILVPVVLKTKYRSRAGRSLTNPTNPRARPSGMGTV